MNRLILILLSLSASFVTFGSAFSIVPQSQMGSRSMTRSFAPSQLLKPDGVNPSTTRLFMADKERAKSAKRKVGLIDKVKPEEARDPIKEEPWRVVLHNDEVHTFNYVIRSLCKVIGTLDRKAAFEICVQTHGIGKATVTKTWKKQAEQFCLGLQRQGLTVSISPDKDFDGGHSGGGL